MPRDSVFAFFVALVFLSAWAFGENDAAPAPGAAAPAWAADAVWYQIFPERFRNGDLNNDPTRDSLEEPESVSEKWRVTPWTGDWYARDTWETEQDEPNKPGEKKDAEPDFYKHGVFNRRYGGDLQGVLEKLDYLRGLGVNALYFTPLFAARSLHKYDAATFHHIDPHFGPDPRGDMALMEKETRDPATWRWTAADKLFLEVVKQAHARDMRVILDGAFNHTGRDFFAFQDVRKKQAASRYKDWFAITAFDDPKTPRDEFDYKGWAGFKSLPVFASTPDGHDLAPGPKAYVFDITRRWMTPNGDARAGVDGWRLDAADQRPTRFWKEWNTLVRTLKPDAYTSAEFWGPAAEFLIDGGFSAAMNYHAFAFPVKGALIDGFVPLSNFATMLDARRCALPPRVALAMQNLIDSHDTARLASMIVNGSGAIYQSPNQIEYSTGRDDARASATYKIRKPDARERAIQRLAVLFQMTYIGAPMIYYGDEAGMWGGHDPDDRMPMVWEEMKFAPQAIDPRGNPRAPDAAGFDAEVFKFYKNAIALRREHPALRRGSYRSLGANDATRTFAFLREEDSEKIVVALNRSEQPQSIAIAVPAGMENAMPIFSTNGGPGGVEVRAVVGASGALQITLPALTGAVLWTGRN